jgi:hypothetical protein
MPATTGLSLMGAGGLEPPQSCDLRILSPLRLPITPCPPCHRKGFQGFGLANVCLKTKQTQQTCPLLPHPVEASASYD